MKEITHENISFLELVDEELKLKKTDKYYYQVMGQLKIARKKYCYFVVYTVSDIHIELIQFDQDFFPKEMERKLVQFYENFYVPHVAAELVK